MSHNHHTNIHAQTAKVYLACIILNLSYVVIEGVAGLLVGSVGLLSDAGHNLSDVLALLLSLLSFRLAQTTAKGRYTFGLRKLSVHISLFNAVILIVAIALITAGAISKIVHPAPVDGTAISVTAGIGIVVNGFTAWLLMRQNQKDVNNKAAFLHMLADTLVSAGVVLSGVVVNLTGWVLIDPLVSLAIAAVILVGSIKLLVENFSLSVDAVPESYDIDDIKAKIESCEGILEAEHIHIWPISTSEVALTAHVVVRDIASVERYVALVKQTLSEAGIEHSTIEAGTVPDPTPAGKI